MAKKLDYRDELAKFNGKVISVTAVVKGKEKSKKDPEIYKVLLREIYKEDTLLVDHLHIFIPKAKADELEINDVIKFKGKVESYFTYKKIDGIDIKFKAYGINGIKSLQKLT